MRSSLLHFPSSARFQHSAPTALRSSKLPRAAAASAALVTLLLASSSFAQDSDTDSKDAASETPSVEEKSVEASPEVQTQVGVGTEKETEEGNAYDPTSPFAEAESHRRKKSFGHGLQLGARGGIVFPYKILFRFEESPLCDVVQDAATADNDAKTCAFVSSPQLDLALSFAPLDSVEPFVWTRIGLGQETETGTDSALMFGAGIRIYTMSEAKFKLFFEAAGGFGVEGAINPADEEARRYGTQFFGHLGFGPQFDFNRYIGLYAALGPGVAVPRAITMQLEATAGLQARLP